MRSGRKVAFLTCRGINLYFSHRLATGYTFSFYLFYFFYPVLPVACKVSHVGAPANSPSHALKHFNHQHSKAALRRYASDSSFLSLRLSRWLSTTGCKVYGHSGKLHISSFQKIFPSRLTCTTEFVPVAHTEIDCQRTLFHK